jgi:hypothetical protein
MSRCQAPFDVFVIGGGVNGTGIARDAGGRGYSVMLAEMDDLASGTSSAATKLVHGGLRYLEHYKFRLVHEALAEREVLWASAPHIIWPLRFVLPHHKGLRPAWLLRLGLFVYDNLGGRKLLPGTRRWTSQGTRRASRSSPGSAGPSNIRTAGWTMRAWSRSTPRTRPSAAPDPHAHQGRIGARESGLWRSSSRGQRARDLGIGAAARQRGGPVGRRGDEPAHWDANGGTMCAWSRAATSSRASSSSTTAATSSRTPTTASSSPFPMRATSP